MAGPNTNQPRLRQYDEIRRAPTHRSTTPEAPIRTYETPVRNYEAAPAMPEPMIPPQAIQNLSRTESRKSSKRGKKSRVTVQDSDEYEPEPEVRPRHASSASTFAPMPVPSVMVQPAVRSDVIELSCS